MTATRYSTRHGSRGISDFTIRTETWREAYESCGACVEILIGYIHRRYLSYCDKDSQRLNKLWGWVDADFAADLDTRRSHTGYILMLNGGAVS